MGTEDSWRTLSARVLEDEHDRYAEIAKLRGLSLSALVRETMDVMYPKELFAEQKENLLAPAAALETPAAALSGGAATTPAHVAPNAATPTSVMGFGTLGEAGVLDMEDGLAAAFAALDGHDSGRAPMGTVHGQPPSRTEPVKGSGSMLIPGGPPVTNDSHPCRHLNIVPPVGHTRGDCQGSCTAQHGRPCHWPANVATDCATYRPLATGPHKRIG